MEQQPKNTSSVKKLITIVFVFIFVVVGIQTVMLILSDNTGMLPDWLTNALNPNHELVSTTPTITPIPPTPAYMGEISVIEPQLEVGGTIASINDTKIVVNTLAGEFTVNKSTITAHYQSTPDNVVVKTYATLDELNLTVGDLVTIVQNNNTNAIVKFVAQLE